MSAFIPITIILFILLIIFIALYFTKKCDPCICPECEECVKCPCPLDGTIGSVVLPIPDENRSTTLRFPIKKLDSNIDISEDVLYKGYDESDTKNKLYGSGWDGTICPANNYYDAWSNNWFCIANPDNAEFKSSVSY